MAIIFFLNSKWAEEDGDLNITIIDEHRQRIREAFTKRMQAVPEIGKNNADVPVYPLHELERVWEQLKSLS